MTENDEQYKTYRFFMSELRSPLAAVKGYTELVSWLFDDEPQDLGRFLEYVKRARKSITRATDMIDHYVEHGEVLEKPPRDKK